jgi:predicted Zn finger-like uncharacterized protein
VAAITACPNCQRQLKVPETLLGKTVRCPSCKATFVAQGAEEAPIAMIDEEPRAPAPGPGASDAQTAARRRVRVSEAAASAVKGPAICLLVVGILAILLALLNGAYGLISPNAMQQANNPPFGGNPQFGGQQPPQSFLVVFYIGAVVAGLLWGSLVTAGAISMLRLRLYGLAMTGSIVGMVPCSMCCLFGLPFGIWALVILNRPEVKNAFT